jgi:hypothetical protein
MAKPHNANMVRFCGFGGRRTACLCNAQWEGESTVPSNPQHQSQSRWSTATPHPLYPLKDPVVIVQETGLASARVWMGMEILFPHRDSIPGPASTYQVAVPTELSRPPPQNIYRLFIILVSFCRTFYFTRKLHFPNWRYAPHSVRIVTTALDTAIWTGFMAV